MNKKQYNEMKEHATNIPEGNVFANGLYGYITENAHKFTKQELVTLLCEMDYHIQVQASQADQANRIYDAMFGNYSELPERLDIS